MHTPKKLDVRSGYGCVYRPAMPCDNQSYEDVNNHVTKLQKSKHAIREYNAYNLFKEIDPAEQYTINNAVICDAPSKYDNYYKECDKYTEEDTYKLINIPDGKNTLDDAVANIISDYNSSGDLVAFVNNMEHVMNAFANLMHGINLFMSKGVVHTDIKPDNIVYDAEKKQCG